MQTARAEGPEAPGSLDRLRWWAWRLLPHHALSRIAFGLTRLERPAWLKNAAIRTFVWWFNVDLSEAAAPAPEAYPHFNAFFTRALAGACRPWPADADAAGAPVDGVVSAAGALTGDRLLQAKGHDFSIETLLGGEAARAAPFRDGLFATLYLSPRDYHRVHMPLAGELRETVHIPGRLFSVAPWACRGVPALFARNERVASVFDGPHGPFAVVMVGALFVGCIETIWSGVVTPPRGRRVTVTRHGAPPSDAPAITLSRGAEMGRFNMGSTVILLAPPGHLIWDTHLVPGQRVRVGESIGRITARRDVRRGLRETP